SPARCICPLSAAGKGGASLRDIGLPGPAARRASSSFPAVMFLVAERAGCYSNTAVGFAAVRRAAQFCKPPRNRHLSPDREEALVSCRIPTRGNPHHGERQNHFSRR